VEGGKIIDTPPGPVGTGGYTGAAPYAKIGYDADLIPRTVDTIFYRTNGNAGMTIDALILYYFYNWGERKIHGTSRGIFYNRCGWCIFSIYF
jgi:hypothetical protein